MTRRSRQEVLFSLSDLSCGDARPSFQNAAEKTSVSRSTVEQEVRIAEKVGVAQFSFVQIFILSPYRGCRKRVEKVERVKEVKEVKEAR